MVRCPYCGNPKAVKIGKRIKCNICGYGLTKTDIKTWKRSVRRSRKKKRLIRKYYKKFQTKRRR